MPRGWKELYVWQGCQSDFHLYMSLARKRHLQAPSSERSVIFFYHLSAPNEKKEQKTQPWEAVNEISELFDSILDDANKYETLELNYSSRFTLPNGLHTLLIVEIVIIITTIVSTITTIQNDNDTYLQNNNVFFQIHFISYMYTYFVKIDANAICCWNCYYNDHARYKK